MAVEPNRWGVIYNPKAGTRKVQKRWDEIRGYIESRGVDFDYVHSEGYGSVERLARTLANNGYRTIVVVGGDGALNDALNGILASHTGQSVKKIEKDTERDFFMSAEEAVKYGLVDGVVSRPGNAENK